MRQRVHDGGVDRQHRVEEVREADALRLRDEAEQRTVAVETPRPALLHELEPGLIVAIEQFVRDLAGGRLVGEFEGLGAEPLHADDDHHRVGNDPPHRCTWLKFFELDHASRPSAVNESCGFRLGRSSDPVNRVPAESRPPRFFRPETSSACPTAQEGSCTIRSAYLGMAVAFDTST